MGGSSNNDTGGGGVGGVDSVGGGGATDPSNDKDSFDRAMDNAERPDRAPAAPADTASRSDNDSDQRDTDRPDDRPSGSDKSETDEPDRAAGPPGVGAPPSSTSPADTDNRPDDNDDPDDRDIANDKPDRAAGPPGIGAPPSSTAPADTAKDPDDTDDDRDDRSFIDRVADTLSAPPTDAEGNVRSTSPVADRVRNHTVNYSLDDVKNALVDDPGLTPEQSQALEEGAAVIDGVTVVPATFTKSAAPAPLSPLQAATSLADAELAVSMEVYERETTAKIGEIDDRIDTINQQLDQGAVQDASEGLHLGAERARLSIERQELENTLASPDSIERALRDGDDKIGLSPDVLEGVVTKRNELAEKIDAKKEELDAAPANHPDTLALRDDLLDLQDDYRNMTDLGIAYQDLVDQEQRLQDGETITVSAKHPYEDFVVERLVDGVLSLSPQAKGLGTAMKWGSKAVDNVPATYGPELTITRREDGVYEVMQLMEPFTNAPNNGVFDSREVHYEFRPDGRVTLTKEVFNPVPGNPMPGEGERYVEDLNVPADDFDLEKVTHGRAAFIDGEIRINPDVREAFEKPVASDSSPP